MFMLMAQNIDPTNISQAFALSVPQLLPYLLQLATNLSTGKVEKWV